MSCAAAVRAEIQLQAACADATSLTLSCTLSICIPEVLFIVDNTFSQLSKLALMVVSYQFWKAKLAHTKQDFGLGLTMQD